MEEIEPPTPTPLELSPAASRFIQHWGELSARWGINRSVAQVHALLYVAARPLAADEIVAALGLARSNVSTVLRELQAWGLARVSHVPGDRRDHFVTPGDVWEMFEVIIAERKRREIDPAIVLLRECLAEGKSKGRGSPVSEARLRELLGFLETAVGFYEQMRVLPRATLQKAMRLGQGLTRLLEHVPRRS